MRLGAVRRLHRVLAALIFATAALALGLHIGRPLLHQRHEVRVLESAREMLERGDWLVPHFCGEVRLQKPPLAYWGAASASAIGGDRRGVLAPRVVMAGLGLLMLAATAVLARALAGRRAVVPAVAILGSSLLFLSEFRRCTPDPWLASLCTVAVAAFAVAWRGDGVSARTARLVGCIATAGALLAKGPIALVFVGLGLGFTRPVAPRPMAWGRLAGGLTLALVPLLAWAALVSTSTPGGLEVWTSEIGARLGDTEGSRSVFFYLPALGLVIAPWSLVLIAALVVPRAPSAGAARRLLFAGLVFLTALSSRKNAYLLPLLPAAAIVTAQLVAATPRGWRRGLLEVQRVLVGLAGLGLIALAAARRTALTESVTAVGAVLLVILALMFAGAIRRRTTRSLVLLATLLAMTLYASVLRSHEHEDASTRNLGRFIDLTVPDDADLYAIGVREPVTAFYANRTPVPWPADAALPSGVTRERWVLTAVDQADRFAADLIARARAGEQDEIVLLRLRR